MNRHTGKTLVMENFWIALEIVQTHKLRSCLIVLGVAIGVASLMGMVSILLGLGQQITEDISSSEQTVVGVMKFDFLSGGFLDESQRMRRDLTEGDAKAIRNNAVSLHHVTYHIEPQTRFYTLRYDKEKSRMIQVVGSQPGLLYLWSLDLEEGRMFTEEEVRRREKVIVLGHSPRRDLFPSVDPIGKRVRIGANQYTVIGTFEERKTLFGSLGENFALLPYSTFLIDLWKESDYRHIFAAVRSGYRVEEAEQELIRIMRIQRGLKADQDNDFDLFTSDAITEFLDRITGPIALILATISSIGLLVGGIGVMNMMLVSVTERTGEIGIRKAMGATRRDILWQFLIEAGTLTGIGGVLGTALGVAGAILISELTGLPASLSLYYLTIAVLFSIGIGVFFGLYPASRASKLAPVEAMGYAK